MNKTEELLKGLALDYQKNKAEIKTTFKRLKKKKPKALDDFVHQLHDDVFEEIDCLACANCCKSLGPRLTDNDVARLPKHLKMKPSDFVQEYLQIDEDKDMVFKTMPCVFLLPDNYCMVYESRPKACREYPHTDRKRFYQVLDITEKNPETCPAVMEVSKAIVMEFS